MGFRDCGGISWTVTQTICTSLQTDDNAHQHLFTQFLQTGCSSRCPANSVKAPKAVKKRINKLEIGSAASRSESVHTHTHAHKRTDEQVENIMLSAAHTMTGGSRYNKQTNEETNKQADKQA